MRFSTELPLSLKLARQFRYMVVASMLLYFPKLAVADDYSDIDRDKIEQIAKQIRQQNKWQIISIKTDNKSGNEKSESTKARRLFRFKLLSKNGDVKIVNIDLDNFDILRQLK